MKVTLGGSIKEVGSTVKTKTGGWRSERPVFDMEKCIECNSCWLYCPENSVKVTIEGPRRSYSVDLDFCKGCGICANECPSEAITMVLEEK